VPAVAVEERRPGVAPPRTGATRGTIAAAAVAACCVAIGVVLRWWPRGALWLDEAQSVAFAELPLRAIPGALRHDGAPPAYYLLLHGWIAVFGDSDTSVRWLSAFLSTATLLLVALWARRRWGNTVGLVAAGLLAVNPFAIRYGAETRMYALVMFEVVVGLVVVDWAWRRPTLPRLAALAALSALLLYTHYWAIYLLLAAAGGLLLAARRGRRPARQLAFAVLAGFVLWIPWVPTFLYQSRHTGTPWASPASLPAGLQVFWPNLGGPNLVMFSFGLAMVVAFLVGATVDRAPRRGPTSSWALAFAAVATVALGVSGAILSSSAVSTRYLAVAVPLVVVVAALGIAMLAPTRRWTALAVVGVGGLWLAMVDVASPRTPAARVVDELAARSLPGDVVVYCPDQLAPAVHRILGQRQMDLTEVVVPHGSTPARVDWVDYESRALAASPDSVVASVLATDPPAVWLVVSTTYPPTQPACRGLLDGFLSSGRTTRRLFGDAATMVEHEGLWWFGQPAGRPAVRL
jgi:mannosyltransferase